jgi:hypothetical protein
MPQLGYRTIKYSYVTKLGRFTLNYWKETVLPPIERVLGGGGTFPGVKRPGPEAEYSLTTKAEVKKTWIYTSTPSYVYMVYV